MTEVVGRACGPKERPVEVVSGGRGDRLVHINEASAIVE